MHPAWLTIRLSVVRHLALMYPDQRLQRVEALRGRILEGLTILRSTERHSLEWEQVLAQLELLWGDLFCLLEELELS